MRIRSGLAKVQACAAVLLALVGCGADAIIIITVADPQNVAGRADRLTVGSSPTDREERALDGLRFPVTMALTAAHGTSGIAEVEAWSQATVVGRNRVEVLFDESALGGIDIDLLEPCIESQDCSNDVWCDGAEQCLDGLCAEGERPCPDLKTECVTVTCLEDQDACLVDRSC